MSASNKNQSTHYHPSLKRKWQEIILSDRFVIRRVQNYSFRVLVVAMKMENIVSCFPEKDCRMCPITTCDCATARDLFNRVIIVCCRKLTTEFRYRIYQLC